MRIGRQDLQNSRPRRTELTDAAKLSSVEGRICGVSCPADCPSCGATNCQRRCSAVCPDAPAMMSEDPVKEPIEPAAAPLVFAVKRLEMFQPCWPCEGRTGLDGSLRKLRKIWFYTGSLVGVGLADLQNDLTIMDRSLPGMIGNQAAILMRELPGD